MFKHSAYFETVTSPCIYFYRILEESVHKSAKECVNMFYGDVVMRGSQGSTLSLIPYVRKREFGWLPIQRAWNMFCSLCCVV